MVQRLREKTQAGMMACKKALTEAGGDEEKAIEILRKAGEQPSEELRKELVAWVRKEIGPIASPDLIQFAPGLPKTRSGKIMRRILRKIAEDEYGSLGDTSTLADPSVVDDLVSNRQNRKAHA